jgi:hypothetical protein
MNTFLPAVALAALVLKFNDFLKAVSNRQWSAVITQMCVWGSAIAAIFIAGATQFAHGLVIDGVSLHALGGWDKAFVGLTLGSTGSTAFDTLASLNSTNDNATRKLKLPSVSVKFGVVRRAASEEKELPVTTSTHTTHVDA